MQAGTGTQHSELHLQIIFNPESWGINCSSAPGLQSSWKPEKRTRNVRRLQRLSVKVLMQWRSLPAPRDSSPLISTLKKSYQDKFNKKLSESVKYKVFKVYQYFYYYYYYYFLKRVFLWVWWFVFYVVTGQAKNYIIKERERERERERESILVPIIARLLKKLFQKHLQN